MTETHVPTAGESCRSCGAAMPSGTKFCESCGVALGSTAAAPPADPGARPLQTDVTGPLDDLGSGPISAATHANPGAVATVPARIPCGDCGSDVGPDGYCEQCGTKAPSARDHFREAPADWVAGVCDRGIRHSRNEDAMALLASPVPGERAVLIVLDGVSNTDDSDVGSLAGAGAARELLRIPLPQGMGTPEGRLAAVTKAFAAALDAAQEAVVAATPPDSVNPPSATFVCVVVEGNRLSFANVGDSRAYWLPDHGEGVQLSVDDSVAQQMMEAGFAREQAETSPQAHAITKWLGRDSRDHAPRVGELDVTGPGWVLVCSDGLWNYASEPAALSAQITASGATDPAALALALVGFANAQGGQDNITATLARIAAPEDTHG